MQGFYASEAGINRGMGFYRNIFLDYQQPAGSDFDQKSFMLGQRTVKYQLQAVCDPPNPTGSCPRQEIIGAGRPYAGLTSLLYRYTALATSELTVGDVETSLGTEFHVNYIPLFQFLAFYQDDLEILPGPNMTLNGPIHTNGSLYLNAGNTMNVADLPPAQPDRERHVRGRHLARPQGQHR